MQKPTVALCMIAKDKADILERVLDSTIYKDAPLFDSYCLSDTGSTDNTIEFFKTWCARHGVDCKVSSGLLGKEYKYVVVDGVPTLGDFAKARNDSFALAKTDWAFWIDTDDILVIEQDSKIPGLNPIQEIITIAEKRDFNQIGMIYNYHKTGNLKTVTQRRERLIKLSVPGQWEERVHENYLLTKEEETKIMFIDHIYVDHLRTAFETVATSRRNNLIMRDVLESEGVEKMSDKMLRDLAYDHWEHNEWKDAIELFTAYLRRVENVPNVNPEAIFTIYIKLARAYINSGDMDTAMVMAMKAMVIMPERAEGYLLVAEIYGNYNMWAEAVHYADKALDIGIPRTTSPINEIEFTILPLRIKMQAARMSGAYNEASKIASQLIQMLPGNDTFKQEKNELTNNVLTKDAVNGVANLVRFYIENNKGKEIDKLLAAIPLEIKDQEIVRELIKEIKHEHKRNTKHFEFKGSKKIVIYAGAHFETWHGHSDNEDGIGGSEGMTIQIARELAALGNDVTVYNQCDVRDGETFDGVLYLDHSKWNTTIECDVFISLRNPTVFKMLPLITAKKQYLWLHDTEYGAQERSNFYAANKVIVLSEYHQEVIKQNHGILDTSKFWITRNALNKKAMELVNSKPIIRVPYKMIYGSSYDRGLVNALKMLPKIREAIPEAELHVFYGWNTFDGLMKLRRGTPSGDYMENMKREIMAHMDQPGVVHHGRVSQTELYEQFASSDIWLYPTEFTEISCITAMQAQALGAIPFCTPVAALKETVSSKYGVKTTLEDMQDTLIYYLKNRDLLEKRRVPMMEWASKKFDVVALAKEWDEFFNND